MLGNNITDYILKTVKTNDNKFLENITVCTLENSNNVKEGVWVLLGKRTLDSNWESLQVAKSIDMCSEIRSDIRLMDNSQLFNSGDKMYINQFGKYCFTFPSDMLPRKALYKFIREQYQYLKFVIVFNSDDDKERKKIEKYIAYKTKAKFWRNGRPYQSEKKIDMKIFDDKAKELSKEIRFDSSCLNDFLMQ